MHPIVLKTKFDPYILREKESNPEKKHLFGMLSSFFKNLPESTEIFSTQLGFKPKEGKTHIVSHPNLRKLILKGPRRDEHAEDAAIDQHIYRVRKASKIKQIIKKRGFTEYVVPEKFLFEHRGEWIVVAKKLKLDRNAIIDNKKPNKITLDESERLHFRQITPKQAEEGAYIAYEAELIDIGRHNLFFDKLGKIALIDTEPTSRGRKKKKQALRWLPILPDEKATISLKRGNFASSCLKYLCGTEEAKRAIERVQIKKVFLHSAFLILEMVIPLFAALGILYATNFAYAPAIILITALHCVRVTHLLVTSIANLLFYRTSQGHKQAATTAETGTNPNDI